MTAATADNTARAGGGADDDTGGWEEILDETTGHVYYHHRKRRVSQWERPAELPCEPAAKEDAGTAPAPPDTADDDEDKEPEDEWAVHTTDELGPCRKTFYHNRKTRKSCWQHPGSVPRTPLEWPPVPVSRSMLWKLQPAFYEAAGQDAWASGAVPFGITTSAYLAKAYVRMVLAHVADSRAMATAAGAIASSDRKIWIIELGPS